MIGLDMSSHLTAKIPLEMSNICIVHCWRRIACEWGLETADNEYFLPFRAVCILHLLVFFHKTRMLYFLCNIKCIFCFNFNMLFFHISLHCQRSSTDRLWSLNFMKRNIKTEIHFTSISRNERLRLIKNHWTYKRLDV
jgi:hypothetical protein